MANSMCHECSELQREIERIRAAMGVLRGQNIKLAVENNNMRNVLGRPMLSVSQGYLVEWERKQEGGAA